MYGFGKKPLKTPKNKQSKKMEELADFLAKKNSSPFIVPCKVTAVNGSVLDAEPLQGGAEYFDVLYQIENEQGVVQMPSVGSVVWVYVSKTPFCLEVSALDFWKLFIKGGVQVSFEKKVSVKNDAASLSGITADLVGLLGDIKSTLNTFKVICAPAGSPSVSLEPVTLLNVQELAVKITAFEQKINALIE